METLALLGSWACSPPNRWLSWVPSLPTHLADLGVCPPSNFWDTFLWSISLSFCFSGKPWLTHTLSLSSQSPAPSPSNVRLSWDYTSFSSTTLENPSETILNFRSTVWNYNSGSRPGFWEFFCFVFVFVANPKKKINESKWGKKTVYEAMIDVEHLKELLCEPCFCPKTPGPCLVLHYGLLLFISVMFSKTQRKGPLLGTHRSPHSWTV